jgi:peroxiredoxin Q/BCP
MAELKTGSKAPQIQLLTDTGAQFKLSDLKGRNVVVYFYPKADTPGCTREACSFRDHEADLTKIAAAVVGISPDQPPALAKFKTKYNLNFPLLSDPEHAVAEAYGVWVEKSNYGRKYMGLERSTFLIDKDGKIATIFRNVKVDGHTEAVLAALATLPA